MRSVFAVVLASLGVVTLSAGIGPSLPIEARAKGAQRVVVGTIVDVHARFHVNGFGDRLIVTDATVEVEETLKGPAAQFLSMTVEGGTVGDLTLHVSDMPAVARGERAVFFLDAEAAGRHVPHGRGLGVIKLDASGRVAQSKTTLADLKGRVRSALK